MHVKEHLGNVEILERGKKVKPHRILSWLKCKHCTIYVIHEEYTAQDF